jgi:sugar/nucleoside kinase (ribokinase family)
MGVIIVKKRGIVSGGNLIVDYVKTIETYPVQGNLSTILSIERSVGGATPNVLIDIAKIDGEGSIPLQAIGLVGDDENGRFIVDTLNKHNIDTSLVKKHSFLGTSFTDVMSVKSTGERTFFQYRGANAELGLEQFDFSNINAEIIHIGYALLLDTMDSYDREYGTVMARVLAQAQGRGIKTSIDVVSENSDRFSKIVPPSLKYTDYCTINEVEASMITGIPARQENGNLLVGNIKSICKRLLEMGVKRWAVIHAPEAGFGMSNTGEFFVQPSLDLPEGYIKGKVGAGDAFCAGILYSVYKGWGMEEALKIATGAAACNLSHANSTDGMKNINEVRKVFDTYPKKKLS